MTQAEDIVPTTIPCWPLTASQREVWFEQCLYPRSPLYNIGCYLDLDGPLVPERMVQAINSLVARHDALRTVLVTSDAHLPRQRFLPRLTLDVPLLDFSRHPDPTAAARDWMQTRFVEPFQLEQQPLLRFALLRLGAQHHYLWSVYHHLIVDGWSIAQINRELGTLYSALAESQGSPGPVPLPPAPSYRDGFAADQAYGTSPRYTADRRHWLARHREPAPPLLPPRHQARFAEPAPSGLETLWLPGDHYRMLHRLAAGQGGSLLHLFLAVLYVYFTRTRGQEALNIGVPVLNRPNAQARRTVGQHAGVSVVRLAFGQDLSFAQLLQSIARTLRRDLRHQRFPVSELNPTLGLHPDGRSRLYDLVLNYAPLHQDTAFGPARARTVTLNNHHDPVPLSVAVWEFHTDADVQVDIGFNRAYLDAQEARRLGRHLQHLLETVTRQGDTPIYRMNLVSEAERARLLAWNDTGAPSPPDTTIVQRFQSQVRRRPQAPAVVMAGRTLSYADLNARANRLAHALMARGVGPEDRVGLCVGRCPAMVVGLLGILKAGGTAVPLDPNLPPARLAWQLQDSGAALLVGQTPLTGRLSGFPGLSLNLDDGGTLSDAYPDTDPPCRAGPDRLAYFIYTSGSTGRPKGVMVQHRSLAHQMAAIQNRYGMTAGDRVLQFAALGFDAALEQIFSALLAGASLYPRGDELWSPARLWDFLARHRITVMDLPPAYWRQVVLATAQASPPPILKDLRLVILGGEALPADSLAPWRRGPFRGARLVNAYGPTEATITATLFDVPSDCHQQPGSVPIGRPLAHTRAYVLDRRLQPLPVGVAGELCLAGTGLARGYRNRPGLTAETFVQARVLGRRERLYRSGDLACWREDGQLVYLGRLDRQIKLRGLRIEPGEIEAVLVRHPAVDEAVVVPQGTGEQCRLMAYVVVQGSQPPDPADLSAHLQEQLPDYMVPAGFIRLPALPRTAAGKVDLKALPEPTPPAPTAGRRPLTDRETLLAGLWTEVLETPVTDPQAHFFHRGGHSLLATRLTARVRQVFQRELPLRVIFEEPTLAGQARWLSRQARPAALPPLTPQPPGAPLVPSYAQQRLWFLAQLDGPGAGYNMPVALELHGELDPAALRTSLTALTARHDSLRLYFPAVGGQPTARRLEPYDPLTEEDLGALPAADREARLAAAIASHAVEPFDLNRGPLLRAHLLHLAPRRHVLLLNLHHSISDGWSQGVLLRDWSELYGAARERRAAVLPDLPVSYTDYAAWQRRWLKGDMLAAQMDYWRRHLDGAPTLLALPTDFPRPVRPSGRGGVCRLALGPELTAALHRLGRTQGCTPFMILLAALATLLGRHGAGEDIVIGTPVAGRPHRQLEPLVGLFLNTLALRLDLTDDPTFADLLRQTRQVALAAYAHQDLPFQQLVEALQPERSLSHAPLFQVMLVYQNTPAVELNPAGLTVSPLEPEGSASKFDLNLHWSDTPDGLLGQLHYSTDLFLPATAQRLLQHLKRLLAQAVGDPQRPLSALGLEGPIGPPPMTPVADFETLDESIPRRFRRLALRHPHHPAVVSPAATLSYARLDEYADKVAGSLVARVGSGRRVGLLLGHDPAMVVGLLGVLKAGSTYVPLDPHHPRTRLDFIRRDADLDALITDNKHWDLARALAGDRPMVNLDTLDDGTGPVHLPPVSPDTPAYLLYTSGSTGQPKGVVQNHRNVLHFIRAYAASLGLSADDRLTLLSSYAFDAAVMDLFAALLTGATLHPVDLREHPPETLSHRLRAEGITVFHATPTVFRHWVGSLSAEERFPTVGRVVLGGEAVTRGDVDAYRRHFATHSRLVNLLGSTESSFSLHHELNHDTPLERPAVPVGRPVADTRVVLLDTQGRETDMVGEMAFHSPYLALGYWNRPALTAATFRSDVHGERWYRSGDLARRLPDGNLEYLGRRDGQLKLRGYRIEPGEIETWLTTWPDPANPALKEAAVALRDTGDGGQLVAYLVAAEGADPPVPALRRHLQRHLPSYMLPQRYVALSALPRTPTGKLDRRALPAPAASAPAPGARPLSDSEALLAGLWSQVLGTAVTDPQSHFFRLGGHSLLATRLVARVRQVFGRELPLGVIFEAPTLAAQARHLAQPDGSVTLPLLSPQPPGQPRVLSHAQQRLWFLSRLEGAGATYNLPLALELRGELDLAALRHSLTALTARHDSLRLHFPARDGRPAVDRVQPFDPLETEDLSPWPQAERERRLAANIRRHAGAPFDLSTGPLLRARLLGLERQRHVLLLNLHHIICDGWSLGVLLTDWAELYTAARTRRPARLDPLPLSYTDYAAWQRTWLRGPLLRRQIDYWRRTLDGAPPLLDLPTDFPRPAVRSHRGARHTRLLPAALTGRLQALGRRHGATLYMTLLAAFQLLLARHGAGDDIPVGSPIANRTHAGTEPLCGMFVNTLVLRGRLDPDAGFEELLIQTRRTALEAYAHQDLPFEHLVEALHPQRSLSHSPLFQVMFVLQNTPPPDLDLPDLTLTLLDQQTTFAKFDLTLSARETADGLHCTWEYAADLFRAATIRRLAQRFEVLLTALVADPRCPMDRLDLLPPTEQARLRAWNRTHRDFPRHLTVVDLFQEQARRHPDATAVMVGEQHLSYAQINARANRLAHALIARGVKPDERVGLCMDRCPALVVGLLGILKAGGAYVPLDPDHPPARLAYQLADSGIQRLVSQPEANWDAFRGQVLWLNHGGEPDGVHPQTDPVRRAGPDHLAYVIYTSGSTGQPKGTLLTHGNAAHLAQVQRHGFPLASGDRVLQFASPAFDGSVWEILLALLGGAGLCLPSSEERLSGEALAALLTRRRITHATLPPTVLALLPDRPLPLKVLIVAGEACPPALAARWRRRLAEGGGRFFNGYGPTENTVCATLYEKTDDKAGVLPIGRPIPNSRVYILDKHLQPLPVGVAGELCLAGAGLARGYLNRPALTAERFLEATILGRRERLYRTGDLARWRADGQLEYLGRLDHQIKLRGLRIEPGEIEAVLTRHPAVGEAAVVLHGQGEEQHLAAYLTPRRGQTDAADPAALRSHLQAHLPAYMIPASFTVLDALPLTPNGKLHRQALPEPLRLPSSTTRQPPRDALELALVRIWEALLGVPVGVTDDFFALGGHSLLAVRLTGRLEAQLGRRLPLADLFRHPTVERLATRLRREPAGHREPGSPRVTLQPDGDRAPLFCIHPIGGTVLCYHELARALGRDRPVIGLQAPGLEPGRRPLDRIEALAEHYLTAIREVQPQGPYHLIGWSFGGLVAYELACRLQARGRRMAWLGLLDTAVPAPAGGPMPDAESALNRLLAENLELSQETLDTLTPDQRLTRVLTQIRRTGLWLPPDTDAATVAALCELIRHHLRAGHRYRPGPFAGRVVLFRAEAPSTEAGDNANRARPDLGWGDLVADLDIRPVPGDHLGMMRPPHVEQLAAVLRACLDAAAAPSPSSRFTLAGDPGVKMASSP